jgi:UDPglucose 6-dehydrogenase
VKICMIGAGYVGLVSAACFAEVGWSVECVDTDANRLAKLRRGEIPIYEPGLQDLVARNAMAGRLRFSSDLERAVAAADVVFLAVGTPMRRGDGHADLSHIFAAVEAVALHLQPGTVVATKSTVPVGTSREIEGRLRQQRPDLDVAVCSNPEFLREGSAIEDFMHPDRILVGCDDPRARAVMQSLYQPIAVRSAPVMFVSRESAEIAKYAANAFLAMKVSFINEMADLCEQVGGDVLEVAEAIGRDHRIGDKFLQPGPGYGGSCFPKDVSALVRTGREHRSPLTIVEAVHHANEERKIGLPRWIERAAGGSVRNKTIGVLGVTFKPNTDDMRDAPSLTILPILMSKGARVRVYDPQGWRHQDAALPGVTWCNSALEAAQHADILLVLTEWNEFRTIELRGLKAAMRGDLMVDARNVYRIDQARAAGFRYVGVGRPSGQDYPPQSVQSRRRHEDKILAAE